MALLARRQLSTSTCCAVMAWLPDKLGHIAYRHAAGVLSNAAGGQAAMELLMGRSEVAANVFVLG